MTDPVTAPKMHVIGGLPRSGSTLLCNILNQRPDSYASSTSSLNTVCQGISQIFSTSPEETSRLANIPGTEDHHRHILSSVMQNWHDTDKPVIFDKGRGWSHSGVMLRNALPDAGMIITVRDPREVLASIEKRHRETGVYHGSETLFDRTSNMMSDKGLVGGPIMGVEDLLRRKIPNVYLLGYHDLANNPAQVMKTVEKVCQLDPFEYDFKDIQPTATDLDPMYRNKYPHTGSGEVKPSEMDWREYISEDIAKATLERWPMFSNAFGFTPATTSTVL